MLRNGRPNRTVLRRIAHINDELGPETAAVEVGTPAGLETRAVAAVAAAVVMWGFVPVLVRLSELSGIGFAAWSAVVGGAILTPIGIALGRPVTKATIRAVAPSGMLFAINIATFFASLHLTSVAIAALALALSPIFVALGARVMLSERISPRQAAWMALAVLGFSLVVLPSGSGHIGSNPLAGIGLALTASVAGSLYLVTSKAARRTIPTFQLQNAVYLIAATLLTPLLAATGSVSIPDGRSSALVLVAVVGPVTCGHLLLQWAQPNLPAATTATIIAAHPVAATGLALVILAEPVTTLQVLAGIVGLAAVARVAALTNLAPSSRDPDLR